MKSKIVIGIVVLAVIIAGGWYALKKRAGIVQPINTDKQSEGLILPDVNTAPQSSSSTQITNDNGKTTTKPIVKDPALQTRAMQIIAKPLVINTTITEAKKQEIIKQVDEIKKQIAANYELEMPWLMLGNYRKSLQDYDGAIEAWNFLSTIHPNGYLAFHNLGSLYGFELHNYSKSEENFLKAIKNAPNDIDAYAQLVTVYATSAPEKIEGLLLSGIKTNPSDVSLKIMLGQYYAKVGKTTEAIKYLEEVLKLNPNNIELKTEINQLKQ